MTDIFFTINKDVLPTITGDSEVYRSGKYSLLVRLKSSRKYYSQHDVDDAVYEILIKKNQSETSLITTTNPKDFSTVGNEITIKNVRTEKNTIIIDSIYVGDTLIRDFEKERETELEKKRVKEEEKKRVKEAQRKRDEEEAQEKRDNKEHHIIKFKIDGKSPNSSGERTFTSNVPECTLTIQLEERGYGKNPNTYVITIHYGEFSLKFFSKSIDTLLEKDSDFNIHDFKLNIPNNKITFTYITDANSDIYGIDPKTNFLIEDQNIITYRHYKTDKNKLNKELNKETTFEIGNFDIDNDSVRALGKTFISDDELYEITINEITDKNINKTDRMYNFHVNEDYYDNPRVYVNSLNFILNRNDTETIFKKDSKITLKGLTVIEVEPKFTNKFNTVDFTQLVTGDGTVFKKIKDKYHNHINRFSLTRTAYFDKPEPKQKFGKSKRLSTPYDMDIRYLKNKVSKK
jgi:hypothetical protein